MKQGQDPRALPVDRRRIKEMTKVVLAVIQEWQSVEPPPAGRLSRVLDWLSGHWVIATFALSLVAAVTAWLVYGVSPLQPLEEIAHRQAQYRDEAAKDKFKEQMVKRHLTLGRAFLNIDEYAAAEHEYQQALKLDPANPQAQMGLFKAEVYDSLQGQYNPAVIEQRIRFILQEDPQDPHAYVFLRDLYRPLDEETALKHYEKAQSLDPTVASAYVGLGVLYDKQGKLDEALAMFQKAVALSQYNPAHLNNLAYAYSRQQLYPQAIEVYQRVLQIDADYLLSYHEIAQLYRLQGELDNAFQYQQELIRLLGDERIIALDKNKKPWYFETDLKNPIYFYDLPEKIYYAYYNFSVTLYLLNHKAEAKKYVSKAGHLRLGQNLAATARVLVDFDVKRLAEERTELVKQVNAYRRQFLH